MDDLPWLFRVSSWKGDLLVVDQGRSDERKSNEIERLIIWRREDFSTIDFSEVLRALNVTAVQKERFALSNQQFNLSES